MLSGKGVKGEDVSCVLGGEVGMGVGGGVRGVVGSVWVCEIGHWKRKEEERERGEREKVKGECRVSRNEGRDGVESGKRAAVRC